MNKAVQNATSGSGFRHRLQNSSAETAFDWPETAPLVFPDLDALVDEGSTAKKQSVMKRSGNFVGQYMDSRAQAKWAANNPDSKIANAAPKPEFHSRYADPNHAASSEDVLALLTGGYVKSPWPSLGSGGGGLGGGARGMVGGLFGAGSRAAGLPGGGRGLLGRGLGVQDRGVDRRVGLAWGRNTYQRETGAREADQGLGGRLANRGMGGGLAGGGGAGIVISGVKKFFAKVSSHVYVLLMIITNPLALSIGRSLSTYY